MTNQAGDPTLNTLRALRVNAEDAVIDFYDAIRHAKANGYSYNELDIYTGLPRGTLQNIAAGKNPRFTVE